MRRTFGWVLTVAGVLAAVAGVALAVYLGPDGRRTTGPHAIDTDGAVLVTAPRLIRWVDVQVDVLAEVPVSKPVFVGLGNTVDVESLVADTSRVEVTEFDTPWDPTFTPRDGEKPTVSGAPTALTWWIADGAGLGGASLSTTLPDQPVSLAVIAVGDTDLSGLELTLAYGVKGGFGKAVGLLLIGAAGVVSGRQVRRGEHLLFEDPDEPDDLDEAEDDVEEEVVYVYVDEHGVEHELTEAEVESGEFDVVGETADEPEPDADAEPEGEPGPEPESVGEPPVVYVMVDEHGVERELTADEVAELGDDVEVVDDPDEPGGTR